MTDLGLSILSPDQAEAIADSEGGVPAQDLSPPLHHTTRAGSRSSPPGRALLRHLAIHGRNDEQAPLGSRRREPKRRDHLPGNQPLCAERLEDDPRGLEWRAQLLVVTGIVELTQVRENDRVAARDDVPVLLKPGPAETRGDSLKLGTLNFSRSFFASVLVLAGVFFPRRRLPSYQSIHQAPCFR